MSYSIPWLLFEIFINIFEACLYVWFAGKLLTAKPKRILTAIIFIVLISAAFSVYLFLPDELTLNDVFSDSWIGLIILLYFFVFFSDHWASKLLWFTTYYVLSNTVISLNYYAFSTILGQSFEALLLPGIFRLFFIVFGNIILALVFIFVAHLFSPLKMQKYMRPKSVVVLSLINLSVVLVEELMFRLYPENLVGPSLFLLICCFSLVISLLSLILYRILYEYSETTAKLQYLDQQREGINQRLSEANELFNTISHMQHDMKKHLEVASDLVRQNENEKAGEYLGEIKTRFPHMYSTGCLSLDSALTLRARLMEEQTISFRAELCNLSKLPIKDIDFCAIIMNLLDNAIEELNRSREEMTERYVRLQIRWVRGMLMIRCENPCTSVPIKKTKDGFISRKRASGVGMGILIIKEIVKEANGVVQMEQEDSHFIVLISIPVNEEKLIDAAPNPYAEFY